MRRTLLVAAEAFRTDGTPDFVQPYDWSVSLDPRLRWRDYGALLSDEGLREVKSYADAIGPTKRLIVDSAGNARADDLIRRAHRAGLEVHAWTFRDEPRWLTANYRGDPQREYLNGQRAIQIPRADPARRFRQSPGAGRGCARVVAA